AKRRQNERVQIPCKKCGFLLNGPRCEKCGYAYEAKGVGKTFIPATLVKMTQLEFDKLFEAPVPVKPKKVPKDEKQEFYSGLLGIAEYRGFKPGWAANKYREKFGVWPRALVDAPKTPNKAVRAFLDESYKKWKQEQKQEEAK
ncbi:MAG: hypothetical protein KGL39_56035, partial [Patescibacteria group bacterium]|nr:hypothetical protein [Patescibacteria group bacterium]